MATDTKAVFRGKAPKIMCDLMRDFPVLSIDDAAAILGNIGHECAGFRLLQEQKPTVKGSRGGWGWCQWTGPRRRSFEMHVAATGLDPASDEANYLFLVLELMGPEAGAIAAVTKAKGLEAKVKAFEAAFERAGVKHYPSRLAWAQVALDAYRKVDQAEQSSEPARSAKTTAPAAWEIQAIQQRLSDLGYHEVGLIDGKMGSRTRGALAAFQAHEGLPITAAIDDATRARLGPARPRPIGAERASITAKDLAEEGNTEVKVTGGIKTAAAGTGLLGAIVAAADGVMSWLSDASNRISPLKMMFGSVPEWIWGALVVLAAFALWKAAGAIQKTIVAKVRSGVTA